MDLSSKAKITHPLVLAVCMENAKTIERILHKFAPSKGRFPRIVPVADPDLQVRPGGGGHPDPKIRGGEPVSPKNFFQPFRAPFWSKKKWGRRPRPPGPSAGSATAYGPAFFFFNFHYAPYKKSYCIDVGNPEATRKALSGACI